MTAHPITSYMDFWGRYLREAGRRHPEWHGLGKPTTENYLYQSCALPHCRIGTAFGAIDAPDADVDEYIDWFVDCGERLRRTVDRFRHVVAPYLDGRG